MKIWGNAGERQELILTKILNNKGKYIAYERKSSISDGWKLSRTIRRSYSEENKTRRYIISLRVFVYVQSKVVLCMLSGRCCRGAYSAAPERIGYA